MRHSYPGAVSEGTEGDVKRARVEAASLEPSWGAAPERRPHEKAEVERARVDEHPLQDVLMPAQVRAPEAPGVIQVGEGAFDVLATAPEQALAARAADAPSIAVDRGLRLRRRRPGPSAAIGLGDIGPDLDRLEVDHRLVAAYLCRS